MVELSSDQQKALKNLLEWFGVQERTPFITLGGYAGTGKTTLISILRKDLQEKNKDLKVAFCAYTGKAARVLRSKLVESKTLLPKDFVGTIHSLIYSPIEDEVTKEIIGWKLRKDLPFDLIIVDEASMVDRLIWLDIVSFGVPIIAVGDHGQLPPIRENFNLMEKPMLKLEEIHRQERENPIISLSIMAREEGKIPTGVFGKKIKKFSNLDPDAREEINELLRAYNEETLVLCGYNWTRIQLNTFIRQSLGFESETPQMGDRLICLRNNHQKGICNGMIGTLYSIKEKNQEWYQVEVGMDGEEENYTGIISRVQFNSREPMNFTKERRRILDGDLFDFGYALTVHKAQGSQAKRVILFEQRFKQMDDNEWRRWLYTAVTRAEEELFILG